MFGKGVCNSIRFLRLVNLKVKNHQFMSLENEERSEKHIEKIREEFKNRVCNAEGKTKRAELQRESYRLRKGVQFSV